MVHSTIARGHAFGEGPRFLICDNGGKFGDQFETIAKGTGTKVIHTPVEAPKANSICERFIGSVRRELLDHILILSERHLQRKVKDYARHVNRARPHQGINGQIPIPSNPPPPVVPPLSQLRGIPILGAYIMTTNGLLERRIRSGRRK